MIDHIGITVSDLQKSRFFYSISLGALGYTRAIDTPTAVSFRVCDGPGQSGDPCGDFWLSEGNPAVPRVHFAFGAVSRMAVDAFYAEGIASGGTGNGMPGIRPRYHLSYYAAFLLDPDGYNVEAVCHLPGDPS